MFTSPKLYLISYFYFFSKKTGSELEINILTCVNGVMEFNIRELPLDSSNTNKNTSKPYKNCQNHAYNFTINYRSNESFGLWVDANVPFNSVDNSTINNNQLDDIINSYYNDKISHNKNVTSILPNNNLKFFTSMSLYLSNNDNKPNCFSNNSNTFYFYPNQTFFIHITPSSIISFGADGCEIDLDIRAEQLPLNFDTNKIGLGIFVNVPRVYHEYDVYSRK